MYKSHFQESEENMFNRNSSQALPRGDGPQPLIRLRGLRKSYCSAAGEFPALRGIDLDIRSGEFISIVGKSGSGKTTLINMIAGIDRPTAGEVHIGETAVHRLSEGQMAVWRGRNIGIVFQFFQLLPMLSLVENVMLPMDFSGSFGSRQRKERALHLLDLVGIAEHAYKLPSAVSGGQQQRAAIARALANDPPLIVADEPTGNLDSKTAEDVFCLFEQLVAQGKTFVIVTHDPGLARRVHRSVVISDGEIYNGQVAKAVLGQPDLTPTKVQ
jgi:putative ABC transport system ATP-binding protein